MVAFNAAGEAVDIVTFAGNVVATGTVSGSGIVRVSLGPAPFGASLLSFVLEAGLELTCTPASLPRGSEIMCQARLDSGNPPDVLEWRFEGEGEVVSRSGGGDTWNGPMGASGAVSVSALVNRDVQEASAEVAVTARGWTPFITLDIEVRSCGSGDCPLAYPPTRSEDLGTIALLFGFPSFLSSSIVEVESGPNTGWKYLGGSAMLVKAVSAIIWLNAALTDRRDPFYRFHNGRRGRCDIEEYAGIVLGHEQAHVDLFQARLERAQIGPFLDDQRGMVSLEDFKERIGRVEGRWCMARN